MMLAPGHVASARPISVAFRYPPAVGSSAPNPDPAWEVALTTSVHNRGPQKYGESRPCANLAGVATQILALYV
jgi:hypothetical protein